MWGAAAHATSPEPDVGDVVLRGRVHQRPVAARRGVYEGGDGGGGGGGGTVGPFVCGSAL